ncbi:MAG: hypothetical protein JW910_01705 [Anaerolineae bacterium]|nr:hypothetical protein [Anaerolineae bacterium]
MKKQFLLGLVVVVALMLSLVGVLAQEDMAATVMLGGNDDLGPFLVDANGMTLYMFTNDAPGVSNCTGDCELNWPPLLMDETGQPTLEAGVPGTLGIITREDGSGQVAYNGMPLYYWVNDAAPGDATGQGVRDVWFVVAPPDVSLGGNDELGDFLVGANGMTLYLFTNDEMGVSNCYDDCALNWPPLLVDSADALTTQPGLIGEFGTTERTDGTLQVTYDGMPLYFWVNDAAPGDATGQGVRDVWYIVKPPTVNVGGNEELGPFLIGPNGMTLYLYTEDEADVTNCYDNCAIAWPPLLVAEGETPTAGEGVMGELGVITRDDGGFQVTIDGIPLYYWINDVVPGDATGQNVREVWFVLSP